jgi:hypothetical protein
MSDTQRESHLPANAAAHRADRAAHVRPAGHADQVPPSGAHQAATPNRGEVDATSYVGDPSRGR